jgi:hypothetical protein
MQAKADVRIDAGIDLHSGDYMSVMSVMKKPTSYT